MCHQLVRGESYLGSTSALENLKLIPTDGLPRFNRLRENDRAVLMEGLDDVISAKLQDAIWNMICKRWCFYEDFCHSRRDG